MKVRPSVKKSVQTAKLSKEKVELWLFALTLNTSRDKVKEEII